MTRHDGTTHDETPHRTARRTGAPCDTNRKGAANANGRQPTAQQTSTPHSRAPGQQHSTAEQNTTRRTKQPTPNRSTTQQDAGHRTPPGATAGGGGGDGTSAKRTDRLKGSEPRREKETPLNRGQGQRHGKTRQQQEDKGKRAAGATEGATKQPSGAQQPQGTEATRENAE